MERKQRISSNEKMRTRVSFAKMSEKLGPQKISWLNRSNIIFPSFSHLDMAIFSGQAPDKARSAGLAGALLFFFPIISSLNHHISSYPIISHYINHIKSPWNLLRSPWNPVGNPFFVQPWKEDTCAQCAWTPKPWASSMFGRTSCRCSLSRWRFQMALVVAGSCWKIMRS